MHRRSFAGSLALTVLLAACSRGSADQQAATGATASADTAPGFAFSGDFHGPFGLQLWSIGRYIPQDVPGNLKRVHDWGFREVELAGTYNMSTADFRHALDSAGLRATSMHVPYNMLHDSLSAVLDQATTLGVQYIGVPWLDRPRNRPLTVAQARKVAADFNRWGAAAHERGLTFFYHPHGYEFVADKSGTVPFDVLMKATDSSTVTYQMDVFHVAHPGQDPVALLKKYPGRWQLMHMKDIRNGEPRNNSSGSAEASAMAPIGQGQIDWPAVIAAAQQEGVRKYYLEDESADPMANIPTSIAYLDTVHVKK